MHDQLDNHLLPAINRLPRLESASDAVAVFDSIEEARSKLFASIDEQKALFSIAYESVEADLDAAKKAVQELAESKSRVDDTLAKQDDRLTQVIQRIDSVVAAFNARSTEAERARDEKFGESLQAIRVQIDSAMNEFRGMFDRSGSDLAQKAKSIIQDLEAQKKEATTLLQVIGEIGVAHPFDRTAIENSKSASQWRNYAAWFFAGMVITVVATAWQVGHGLQLTWEFMLFRFLTALVFVIPAAYFAREASKFQDEADRNRRIQLELATVAPFIETLEPSKRDALREELTRRYFSGPGSPRELEKPIDVNSLVAGLLDAIKAKQR